MERPKYIGYFNGYIKLIEVDETTTDLTVLLKIKSRNKKSAQPLIKKLKEEHHAIPVRRMRQIPGYAAIMQLREKKTIEQKELEKKKLIQLAVAQFKEYSQEFSSEAKALLHLIRHLNRYAKCFPRYKLATQGNRNAVSLIYSLKDEWIKRNKTSITSAVLVSEEYNSWIDWDSLHMERDATGEWQNPDDYEIVSTQRVYAYEFKIEDEVVRFHSLIDVVGGKIKYDPNAEGRAQPLTQEERVAFPLKKALYLVCGGLEEDPNRCKDVSDVRPPVHRPGINDWDYWVKI